MTVRSLPDCIRATETVDGANRSVNRQISAYAILCIGELPPVARRKAGLNRSRTGFSAFGTASAMERSAIGFPAAMLEHSVYSEKTSAITTTTEIYPCD